MQMFDEKYESMPRAELEKLQSERLSMTMFNPSGRGQEAA